MSRLPNRAWCRRKSIVSLFFSVSRASLLIIRSDGSCTRFPKRPGSPQSKLGSEDPAVDETRSKKDKAISSIKQQPRVSTICNLHQPLLLSLQFLSYHPTSRAPRGITNHHGRLLASVPTTTSISGPHPLNLRIIIFTTFGRRTNIIFVLTLVWGKWSPRDPAASARTAKIATLILSH